MVKREGCRTFLERRSNFNNVLKAQCYRDREVRYLTAHYGAFCVRPSLGFAFYYFVFHFCSKTEKNEVTRLGIGTGTNSARGCLPTNGLSAPRTRTANFLFILMWNHNWNLPTQRRKTWFQDAAGIPDCLPTTMGYLLQAQDKQILYSYVKS